MKEGEEGDGKIRGWRLLRLWLFRLCPNDVVMDWERDFGRESPQEKEGAKAKTCFDTPPLNEVGLNDGERELLFFYWQVA